jgi:plasmid stabilization system protein ParE
VTYTLAVVPAAEDENTAVIRWYLEQGALEAAVRYSTAITNALDEILVLPLAWPLHRSIRDIRVRRLGTFPYSIVYRVRDGVITVVAFAHTSRRPDYWRDRVR